QIPKIQGKGEIRNQRKESHLKVEFSEAELRTLILLERHRLENSTYPTCPIVIPTTFSTFAEILCD
ncbi:hypothetical protein, partial [Bacteroides intestinalis]|uniref:hypothetical protein n=1 Tax=Bacteroides intestinalis TaxID=329854 RepID=UPI001BB250ED